MCNCLQIHLHRLDPRRIGDALRASVAQSTVHPQKRQSLCVCELRLSIQVAKRYAIRYRPSNKSH
jgi:hypothetical protein